MLAGKWRAGSCPRPGPGEETAQRSRPTPSVNEPPEPKAAPWAVAKSISAEEPAMLQRARTALARGEAREALALLDDHEQRFPAGQLVESREALRIQALMAVGETARARELVVEFRRRFPRSVFLSEVHRAVAGP